MRLTPSDFKLSYSRPLSHCLAASTSASRRNTYCAVGGRRHTAGAEQSTPAATASNAAGRAVRAPLQRQVHGGGRAGRRAARTRGARCAGGRALAARRPRRGLPRCEHPNASSSALRGRPLTSTSCLAQKAAADTLPRELERLDTSRPIHTADMDAEKRTRGLLRSAVQRAVSRDVAVLLDSGNFIKVFHFSHPHGCRPACCPRWGSFPWRPSLAHTCCFAGLSLRALLRGARGRHPLLRVALCPAGRTRALLERRAGERARERHTSRLGLPRPQHWLENACPTCLALHP